MAAFATAAELASWLQVASVDTATANLQLNIASNAIRTYCGWSISQETDVEETVDGECRHRVWLPTLRLTAVSEVLDDADTLTPDDYQFTRRGSLIRQGTRYWWSNEVTVTYTHGWDPVPDVVKGVCLAIAGRGYLNPVAAKATTDTAGPFTRTQSFNGSVDTSMFQPAEMRDLSKFRIQDIA